MLDVPLFLLGLNVNAAPSGGGGGSYTAQAVHIDGPATALRCASLAAADSGQLYYSLWFKRSAYPPFAEVLAVGDPDNDYFMDTDFSSSVGPIGTIVGDFNPASELNSPAKFDGAPQSAYSLDEWHSLIVSVDTNLAAGQKIHSVYIDRQLLAPDPDVADGGDAFTMPFSGRVLSMFDDGFSDGISSSDFADYRFVVGACLHNADGTIPPAKLDLFATAGNKPVDPAVATAALGAPTCLFTGDHTAFATNQGSGGAFTLIGVLTNATTSPSD